MRITCVAGARPNFVKIKPVQDALEARGADVTLVHTGQHFDYDMSEVFFQELGLRAPDHCLNVGSGSHGQQTGRTMMAFESLLQAQGADLVVVVGDVNSTIACALVAAKHGALVAHVESGLRSRDWRMPEEINRVVTDRLSDFLFAPSEDAATNLRREGYREDQIHLVGNVMVDSLLSNLSRAQSRPIREQLGLADKRYGLVTLHRPSNVDDRPTLTKLLGALAELTSNCPLVFPTHPRTRARLKEFQLDCSEIIFCDPIGYLDFICLESGASLVLTDSGGVQEETTVLGVPCLTLRETTERPVTVEQGTNIVVGVEPDTIIRIGREALERGVPRRCPELWDGHAGTRIADILMTDGLARDWRRPSELP